MHCQMLTEFSIVTFDFKTFIVSKALEDQTLKKGHIARGLSNELTSLQFIRAQKLLSRRMDTNFWYTYSIY